ncbi:MAG: hypothetical protein FWD69_04590 [Polyangiaceae bacterium]|nr:hypothetical protein [Polyangiaceae bacterium]
MIHFAKVILTAGRRIEPRIVLVLLAAPATNMSACASAPPPSSRVGTAENTVHDARAVGASADPAANAYLQSAEYALATSKQLIEQRNNEKAAWFAARGQADANLSLSLAREAQAKKADTTEEARNPAAEEDCATERRTP